MIRHHLVRSAALGLTLAACAAPAAFAQQDLRGADARDAASAVQSRSYQDLRSPDVRDLAEGRSSSGAPKVTVVRVAVPARPVPTGGIGWGDAAIGAGLALALGLLVLGSALAVVRHAAATRRSATTRIA